MSRESEGLVARIRHIRDSLPTPDVVSRLRQTAGGDPGLAPLEDLQARVAHLEQLVQGLQDSVYRESQRQDKRMAELEARLDPGALSAALSQDARGRRP
jgi:hypothetical protein